MTIRSTKFTVTNLDTERVFTPDDPFPLNVSSKEGMRSNRDYLSHSAVFGFLTTTVLLTFNLATICLPRWITIYQHQHAHKDQLWFQF